MSNREEAIDILTRMSTNHFYGHREQEAFKLGAEALSEERHGKWILITKDGIYPAEFLCSNCGRKILHGGVKDMVPIHYPYCHCGAKMDEVSE